MKFALYGRTITTTPHPKARSARRSIPRPRPHPHVSVLSGVVTSQAVGGHPRVPEHAGRRLPRRHPPALPGWNAQRPDPGWCASGWSDSRRARWWSSERSGWCRRLHVGHVEHPSRLPVRQLHALPLPAQDGQVNTVLFLNTRLELAYTSSPPSSLLTPPPLDIHPGFSQV